MPSRLIVIRFSLLLAVLPLLMVLAPTAHGEEEEDDVSIPEGYEERRYSLYGLLTGAKDHASDQTAMAVTPTVSLDASQIQEILRTCAAPDSWSKHGPARMSVSGPTLTVVQKKEAHAEIEKVLKWLEENVTPAVRTTVVAAVIKTESARKLANTVSAADLGKVLDEAGEEGLEIVELRGVEGQLSVANAAHEQTFVKDYDVSGAVFDPVVVAHLAGFSASARVYRNPDCATMQADLSVRMTSPATFDKAKIVLQGAYASHVPNVTTETKKDDKGKEVQSETKTVRPGSAPLALSGDLEIELPTHVEAGFETTLVTAPGTFVLAATLDISTASKMAGKTLAVFVRVHGDGKIPTLTGVSGLKEGESFRLYPLSAGQRGLPDFKSLAVEATSMQLAPSAMLLANPMAGVNCFSAAPFATGPQSAMPQQQIALKETIGKAQRAFKEKVRQNKIVTEMGPVVFTRLLDADHARLLKTLTDNSNSNYEPKVLNMLALALPPAAYRKLLLEDHAEFEAAEVEALAGNGAAVLGESRLRTVSWQTSNVFAGERRSVLADYEISGDSYDPVVKSIWGRAYAADFKWQRGAQDSGDTTDVRFNALPAAVVVERGHIDTYSVMQGADTSAMMGMRVDLDKVKRNIVKVRTTTKGASGKYRIAGTTGMPPTTDEKVDARQAVVFVRVSGE